MLGFLEMSSQISEKAAAFLPESNGMNLLKACPKKP